MAVAEKPALRQRGIGEVRRLRNAVRAALPVLTELERVESVDRFGRYVVQPDEEPVTDELQSFLQLARDDHPGQELEIIVIARQGREEHP